MDTNADALRKVYVALGGDEDAAAALLTNADLINGIAALITAGGGSVLPAVSADENGKILKVVDGVWAVGTDAT